jgi:hypothetical protein
LQVYVICSIHLFGVDKFWPGYDQVKVFQLLHTKAKLYHFSNCSIKNNSSHQSQIISGSFFYFHNILDQQFSTWGRSIPGGMWRAQRGIHDTKCQNFLIIFDLGYANSLKPLFKFFGTISSHLWYSFSLISSTWSTVEIFRSIRRCRFKFQHFYFWAEREENKLSIITFIISENNTDPCYDEAKTQMRWNEGQNCH